MIRRLLPLLAFVCGPVTLMAASASSDTLRVNVTVEVVLPDSSRVAKSVSTSVPSPSVRQSVAVAPQVVIAPAVDMAVEAPASAECNLPPDTLASVSDSVTRHAPVDSIVTLLPVPRPYIKPRLSDRMRVCFAWGAELASSVDLSGHDMSSIDFNAYLGLRYRWLSLAGVGAGANIMVSNSCRTYPVFAVVRTDFSRYVKLLFLDFRGGLALNYLPDNVSQQAPYAAASIGFNLARSSKFRSYVLFGYTFIGRKDVASEEMTTEYPSLSMVSVRLGVAF